MAGFSFLLSVRPFWASTSSLCFKCVLTTEVWTSSVWARPNLYASLVHSIHQKSVCFYGNFYDLWYVCKLVKKSISSSFVNSVILTENCVEMSDWTLCWGLKWVSTWGLYVHWCEFIVEMCRIYRWMRPVQPQKYCKLPQRCNVKMKSDL